MTSTGFHFISYYVTFVLKRFREVFSNGSFFIFMIFDFPPPFKRNQQATMGSNDIKLRKSAFNFTGY